MQMIADGKIKEGTRIKIEGVYFEYTDGEFFNNEFNQYLYNYLGYSLKGLVTDTFEILEDKTEEIRLGVDDSNMEYVEFKNGGCTPSGYTKNYNKLDIMFFKRIKKLEEILNKPIDTSKETNCMTREE